MDTPARDLPMDCYAAMHIRPGPPYPDAAKPNIAAEGRFELSPDIGIEKFDKEFAIKFQRACEPANHNIFNDVWDRHLYAFVRCPPESEGSLPPGTVVRDYGIVPLFTAMALSRLVRPTTIGNRYCAKIYPSPAADRPIQALSITGAGPDVTISDPANDWLTPTDGFELRQLMPWLSAPLSKRIQRAFWNHEDAMRTPLLDFRLPVVIAGLEALLTVEKGRGITERFVRRAEKLSRQMGVVLSAPELLQAYRLRSAVVHGRSFLYDLSGVLPEAEHRTVYIKLESLLRLAVKKCLLDNEFRARFDDNDAVLRNYP